MNCVEVSCSPAWIVLRSRFHRMCLRNTSYKIIKKIDWLVAEERSAKKLLNKVETALSCEIICQRWYWKNDFDYNDYKLLVGFWLMWFLVYLRSSSVKCIFCSSDNCYGTVPRWNHTFLIEVFVIVYFDAMLPFSCI